MNCHCNHIVKLAEVEDDKLLKTANFTEKGCNMNVRVDIGFLIIYLLGVSVAASLYHSHTEILLRQLHTEEDKMDVPKQHDQTLESPFLVRVYHPPSAIDSGTVPIPQLFDVYQPHESQT